MNTTEKLKDREVFIQVFEAEKKRLGRKFDTEMAELMKRDKTLVSKIINRKVPVSDDMAEALAALSSLHPDSLNDAGGAYRARSLQEFIRVELKSGNVFHLPIPPGPDGYERAVAAAAALERASRLEQAAAQQAVEDLKKQGLSVPVPPAAGNQ